MLKIASLFELNKFWGNSRTKNLLNVFILFDCIIGWLIIETFFLILIFFTFQKVDHKPQNIIRFMIDDFDKHFIQSWCDFIWEIIPPLILLHCFSYFLLLIFWDLNTNYWLKVFINRLRGYFLFVEKLCISLKLLTYQILFDSLSYLTNRLLSLFFHCLIWILS